MIRIKRLDHVVIRAKNSAAMCDFYCDVLGCTVERESTADLGLIQLRAGNALIDLASVVGLSYCCSSAKCVRRYKVIHISASQIEELDHDKFYYVYN